LHPRDVDADYRDLRDLERLTFHIQDVTQVLSDVIWATDHPFVIPSGQEVPLAAAMARVGDVLRSTEEEDTERQAERIAEADRAVNALTQQVSDGDHTPGAPNAVESVLLSLHRMLRVVKSAARD